MKQLFALGTVLILFLASCTKTNTVTVTDVVNDTTTITVKDTLTLKLTDTLGSNFDLFTRVTWMYTSYYIGYVDSTNLGTVEYQRGASGNLMDYDNARSTFNPDGTVAQINNDGSSTPGTWRFLNNQETQYQVVNAAGTFDGTFTRLDSGHYNFIYNASDGTIRYGTLIPAQ